MTAEGGHGQPEGRASEQDRDLLTARAASSRDGMATNKNRDPIGLSLRRRNSKTESNNGSQEDKNEEQLASEKSQEHRPKPLRLIVANNGLDTNAENISVDEMSFEDTEEKEMIMRNMNSIFKANKDHSESKQEKWRIFGLDPHEYKHSTINPRRG